MKLFFDYYLQNEINRLTNFNKERIIEAYKTTGSYNAAGRAGGCEGKTAKSLLIEWGIVRE